MKTPALSARSLLLVAGAFLVAAVMLWQSLVQGGAPDPTQKGLSTAAMTLSSAVLVFREGLEAILVLAAVTAGVVRNRHGYWRSVLAGSFAAVLATIASWYAVVALLSSINAPALAIQAGTGLIAIVVLLVVMNWFFHKIYWTGWIGHHSKRRNRVLSDPNASASKVAFGLALLGFTAIYREGFEIVIFLQDLRLKGGEGIVFNGMAVGLALTGVVAALTFAAHQKLPYKKMLVLTGGLLALVLVVMVGESAQEMQLAGWLGTHPLPLAIPDWMGTWFALFPNVEGILSQLLAAALVVGSYAWVRSSVGKPVAAEPRGRRELQPASDLSGAR